ncbi:MAG TPA: chloride channel protein [Cyclobacteriaceae bacterium]
MKINDIFIRFLLWRVKHFTNFILISSGFVGLLSGLAAVTLKSAVHLIQGTLEENLDNTGINYLYLGFPLVGILLTLTLTKYFIKDKLGHGITQILYSISKNSSVISRVKIYSRMFTSALTVGFGGSVGLEAPIVVTGSAIGSNLGSLFHLNYKKRSLLIGCGSAGAIAAIFNSPIAGVIFTIEVILTDITINQFVPLLIASVVGALVSLTLLGDDILFSFTLQDAFMLSDVPYFILLGILCGIVSVYFTRLTYYVENKIYEIRNDFGRAFTGGIILAIIIFLFPPIYGEGYDTIKLILNGNESQILNRSLFYGHYDSYLLLILFIISVILVKPIASALTIGAGGSGGIFAPSLFIGGVTGFFLAKVLQFVMGIDISTSNFTLVGMCGLMSGILHAPLTAIFLIAEITGGYTLFVPLMLVSAISYATTLRFEKYSLYTKNLIERGDLIQYDKDRKVLSNLSIKRLIETDLKTIHPDATLDELIEKVKISRRNIFPVVDEKNELHGIVTLDDIRDIMFDDDIRKNTVVNEIMQKPPAFVSPNEEMQSVMNKFEYSNVWNLPVLENKKYVGFLSKSNIFNAYRKRLIKEDQE